MSYALTQTVIDLTGVPLAEKLALIVLARHANNDGGNDRCPAVKTIAAKMGASERTARSALRGLEQKGLIRALGSKIGGRALSTRYLIVLTPETRQDLPGNDETRQNSPPKETRQNLPPNPETRQNLQVNPAKSAAEEVRKKSKEESERAHARRDPRQTSWIAEDEDRFQEFYRAYPRHVAPDAARRAYLAALKKPGVSHAALMEGAARYGHECRDKEARYIKHPATWLNGGCWADEPTDTIPEGKPHGKQHRHSQSRELFRGLAGAFGGDVDPGTDDSGGGFGLAAAGYR